MLLLLCLGASPVWAGDETASAGGESEAAAAPAPGDTPAAAPAGRSPDPWEHFNRAVFRFNDKLDRYALKPVAKGYRKVTPRPVRTGITNFFTNLRAPIVMLNDLLQGKVKAAGSDTARFVVNTTVGVVGLFDVSTKLGLPQHDEDFGQTLGVWGAGPGPYLVLPFLGPSSVRDGIGFGVDVATHPRTYLLDTDVNIGITAADAVNTRANLLDVEEIMQGDRYLFIRDLYLQHREFAVKDGKIEHDPFLDDSEDEAPAPEDNAPAAPDAAPSPQGAAEPATEAPAAAAAEPAAEQF